MTLLVDTNIFLELLLNQERADECEKFLNMVSNEELEAVVTKFTVHAVEALISSRALRKFISNLINSVGLYIY